MVLDLDALRHLHLVDGSQIATLMETDYYLIPISPTQTGLYSHRSRLEGICRSGIVLSE